MQKFAITAQWTFLENETATSLILFNLADIGGCSVSPFSPRLTPSESPSPLLVCPFPSHTPSECTPSDSPPPPPFKSPSPLQGFLPVGVSLPLKVSLPYEPRSKQMIIPLVPSSPVTGGHLKNHGSSKLSKMLHIDIPISIFPFYFYFFLFRFLKVNYRDQKIYGNYAICMLSKEHLKK